MATIVRVKSVLFLVILMIGLSENKVRKPKDWYETAVIYQIYPRSFKDSNGDGIGDLRGILEKLDYIHDVGFDTIWIQTFFKSPMTDFGYDIADYREVDPMFGTLQDLRQLIDAIHDKGMKLMIDLIPNHTSDECEWFKKSVNKEEPYTDFYIWKDPKGRDSENKPIPPNNWVSIFGGSAWVWNEKRQQFYYRLFTVSQPDLNLRNPEVRAAIEEIFRFWMDFGVDGFRLDAVDSYFEDELFRDNPPPKGKFPFNLYYQILLKENYQITREWRLLVEEYKAKDNETRILAGEVFGTAQHLIQWFGNETHRNLHFPFYLELVLRMSSESDAKHLDKLIHDFVDIMPSYGVPSWTTSDHDLHRVTDRMDPEFSDAAMMIDLLLPGIASIYYGEEIGLNNIRVRADQRGDKTILVANLNRDVCRGPMQWDDSNNAGFTTNKKAWLPVNADYWKNNVKNQLGDPHSHLNKFRRLIKLRKLPVIEYGSLDTCVVSEWVHMFVRRLDEEQPVVVIVNIGSETERICLDHCPHLLPDTMQVHTSSQNSGYNIGDKVTLSRMGGKLCSNLRPKAGVVLTSEGHASAGLAAKPHSVFLVTLLLLLLNVTGV